MDNGESLKRRKMMMREVLSHGRNLAFQLQKHLDPSAPKETRDFLIAQILSAYNKALHVAKSDHQRRPSKKRKTLPRWVQKVKVESQTEQWPLSDGHSWRKYGQKVIHGAAFPRGYYRCSHLHSQGCIATKHIQKSDHDPTLFHVTYRGHHTCTVPAQFPTPAITPSETQTSAPESFLFRCFSFSTAMPVLETAAGEVAKDWLIPDASPETSDSNLARSPSSGVWTPESEQGSSTATNSPMPDWPPLFTLEELGIDSNFSFDNPEIFP